MSPRKEKIVVGIVVGVVVASVLGVAVNLGWHNGEAKESCCAKLRKIDGAKGAWAIAHHKTNDNEILKWSDIVGPQSYLRASPKCPSGGTYTLGRLGERPRCTIAEHTL